LYPNAMVAVKETFKANGVLGFYKGAAATVSRDVPWNALSFLFHGAAKGKFAAIKGRAPNDRENLALASAAGMIAAVIMTPVDVVKTRIMTQRLGEAASAKASGGIVGAIRSIAREEGVRALFKGTVPRVMYLAPLAGITLSVYEAVSQYMLRSRNAKSAAILNRKRNLSYLRDNSLVEKPLRPSSGSHVRTTATASRTLLC